MKSKALFISILFFSFLTGLFAQDDDPVLMTIDGQPIKKSEFVRIYKKNNENTLDAKSVDDYLDLFINYKLKVLEAEKLGLDTTKAFLTEFETYKKQLEEPYLTSKVMEDSLLKEAYDRMQNEVNISLIFIRMNANPTPQDTLAAYKKALEIRDRILKGEDFEKVARATSDDHSVVKNGGYYGYFSALTLKDMYNFETVVYQLKDGEISMPVRHKYGYHLIKCNSHRPNPGKVQVAHIMVMVPADAPKDSVDKARKRIEALYEKVKNGEDFGMVANKYSDDKSSARSLGMLPWFTTGKMVEEFENAAFALHEKGEISPIIRSPFGFHIIKLYDRKPLGTYDELKDDLKKLLEKDERSAKIEETFINQIKKESNFTENITVKDQLKAELDSSVFKGQWNPSSTSSVIFSVSDKSVLVQQFVGYLNQAGKSSKKISLPDLFENYYNSFINDNLKEFERTQLPRKYPEFRYLLEEYHDGILLFDLTDSIVWSKAVKDSAGLRNYYEKNKKDKEYLWNDRVKASIYKCSDKKTAESTLQLIEKKIKKNKLTNDDILKQINVKPDSILLTIETKKFLKGDNNLVDSAGWKVGVSPIIESKGKFIIVSIEELIKPEPKAFDDVKGLVIANYQTYLENKWIDELRKKYKIEVNKEILATIK